MDAIIDNLPAIIAALGTFLAALGAFIVALRNSARVAEVKADAAEAKQQIVTIGDELFEIGKRVDGRLSELLAASTARAHAEGRAAGEQAQRDRQASPVEGKAADAIERTALNTEKIAENTEPLKGKQ